MGSILTGSEHKAHIVSSVTSSTSSLRLENPKFFIALLLVHYRKQQFNMIPSIPTMLAVSISLAALPAYAYKIPANLQAFYDKHKIPSHFHRLKHPDSLPS